MKAVRYLLAAVLLSSASATFAGTPVSVVTAGHNITALATPDKNGIRVRGSVVRNLGLGQIDGSIRLCVISPQGKMVSCEKTRVSYPNLRPLSLNRRGHFSVIVEAPPGSTIRVGGCSHC